MLKLVYKLSLDLFINNMTPINNALEVSRMSESTWISRRQENRDKLILSLKAVPHGGRYFMPLPIAALTSTKDHLQSGVTGGSQKEWEWQ